MPAAKSLTVLVVDDQQTMRGLARQCLKKLGVIDVALVASGDHFVSKPFSVSDVREALETHLGALS